MFSFYFALLRYNQIFCADTNIAFKVERKISTSMKEVYRLDALFTTFNRWQGGQQTGRQAAKLNSGEQN